MFQHNVSTGQYPIYKMLNMMRGRTTNVYTCLYISTYTCSYIRWDQVTHNNRGKSYLTPHSTPLPDSALPPAEYKSTRLYVLRINYLLLSLSLYISAHVVSSLCLIAMVRWRHPRDSASCIIWQSYQCKQVHSLYSQSVNFLQSITRKLWKSCHFRVFGIGTVV